MLKYNPTHGHIMDSEEPKNTKDLIHRLLTRAAIRRQIHTRKSVQEGKPDRIADLLEEAADYIEKNCKREV